MGISPDALHALLDELAHWLEFEDCEPVEMVVCGGMALALQRLSVRPTRDLDVLGRWNGATREIELMEDLPAEVKKCVKRVADGHPELSGLDEKWVNPGPGRLAALGLPAGFEQRMTAIKFGRTLTLHVLSRRDLVALKLYAAADYTGARQEIHYQDLRSLNPDFNELDEAVTWIRTLPDFEQVHMELKEIVRRLGHDDLAYCI